MASLNVNSTMKRIWRVAEVLAWTAFFAFAVLLLAGRFWILPKVEEHRDEIAAAAARDGMRTLREDGLAKVQAGVTSLAEVARVTGTS